MTPEDYTRVKNAIAWLREHGFRPIRRGAHPNRIAWTRDEANAVCNLLITYNSRRGRIRLVRASETTFAADVNTLIQAIDYLVVAGLLPMQHSYRFQSGAQMGIASMPWHHFVSDGAAGMREFASYEEAAAWAAPTNEGGPRLPVCRQRRGPWEVAA